MQPSGEEEEDVATSPRKKKPAGGRASDGDEVETIQARSFGYYAFSSTSGSAPMICRHIDEGVEWGFSWLGVTGRFCHKTQMGPAKCVYCVCVPGTVYDVLFPPCGKNVCQVGLQFLSVVDSSKVWGIWCGLDECLIFFTEVGGGGVRGSGALRSPYHYTTWLR